MISSKVFELSNLHVLSYAVSVFFIPPVFSFTVDIFSTPLIIFFVVSSNILICNVQTVHPSNVVYYGLCGLHSSNFKSNHISFIFFSNPNIRLCKSRSLPVFETLLEGELRSTLVPPRDPGTCGLYMPSILPPPSLIEVQL